MADKVAFESAAQKDDDVFQPLPRQGTRIRFGSVGDEEAGRRDTNLRLSRTASNMSSTSIGSMNSRRRRNSIDPATALPITYRTVSYAIEETKEKERVETVRAKKDAAAELGDLEWHTLSINEIETRLSTSLIQGLSKEQVELKQKEFGKNTPSKPPSDLFSRVMGYMFGGFGSVLLIGGILVTITYKPLGNPNPQIANLALAIVLYAVFVIQALFNGWQDWSSSRYVISWTPEQSSLTSLGLWPQFPVCFQMTALFSEMDIVSKLMLLTWFRAISFTSSLATSFQQMFGLSRFLRMQNSIALS